MNVVRVASPTNAPATQTRWGARCRIVLVPSFDYEIFHGHTTATPQETLFAPTSRLLEQADALGIPLTLFADVCSVWRHRDAGDHAFAEQFENQLIDAQRRGHDVQLHIHAHWMRSELVSGEWQLREPKVTLADIGFAGGEAASIVRRGVDYLNGLLRTADPSYRCIAFRAGGLALAPEERSLLAVLQENGIRIDSSIAKDYVLNTDSFRIDYRRMPPTANWNLSPEDGLRGSTQGLFEVPIVTFSLGMRDRVNFLWRRLRSVRDRRGGAMSRSTRQTRISSAFTLARQNLRYLAASPVFLFSADTKGFTKAMLLSGFASFVERQLKRTEPLAFVSMLNHPKLMLPQQESLLFEVLQELRSRYGELLAFATFPQIAQAEDLHA